jgi:class 3 adenylate cyclase
MSEERVQRRLAAILSADVVGYSRLMGMDDAGTLSRLIALRRQLIDPTIAAHSGRIVKLMGDGALVEFASAVDAVSCAIEIQRKLRSTIPVALNRLRSNFGSASTLAISSSRVMTSLATASTSRRGSKASPSVAESRFPRTLGGRFKARSWPTSSMLASRASRTSRGRCASIGWT